MPESLYRYALRTHREVTSALYKMPRAAVENAWRVMRNLEREPKSQASSLVAGHADTFQIKSDGYRIVYEVLEEEKAVKILRIHLVE